MKEITCGLCSEEFPQKAKGNVRLTFKTDNSFIVEEDNSKILETGQWAIITDEFGSGLTVEVKDGFPEYLPGIIGICNNQLFADQTYIDLLGYLYVKID